MEKMFPKYITFEVTNRCNYNCVWCWQNHTHTTEISLELFEILSDEISQNNQTKIAITGGEPFIRFDIFDILDIFIKKKIIIDRLLTNISLLGKKEIKLLEKKNIKNLQISFDGIGTNYDYNTGKEKSYEKFLSNLKMLSKTNCNVQLFYLVSPINYTNDISNIIKICEDLKFNLFVSLPTFLYSSEITNKCEKNNIKIIKNPIKWDYKKILEIIEEKTLAHFPPRDYFKGWYERKNINKNYYCFYPSNHMRIKSDGSVPFCAGMNHEMGNVKDFSINEIWNSRDFKERRNEQNNKTIYNACIRCCKNKFK